MRVRRRLHSEGAGVTGTMYKAGEEIFNLGAVFQDIGFNALARFQGESVNMLLGWFLEAWKTDGPH